MTIYYIHDNHDRPYKVETLPDKIINIYGKINTIDNIYIKDPILKYKYNKIFIGKSPKCPMTEFSGGYGRKYDGNTILLNIKNNEYIWIGEVIISFESNSKIVEYISPVGNNDVPYPYAIDVNRNYYLLLAAPTAYDDPNPEYISTYKYISEKDIPRKEIKEKNPYDSLWRFEGDIDFKGCKNAGDKSKINTIKNVKFINVGPFRKPFYSKTSRPNIRKKSIRKKSIS